MLLWRNWHTRMAKDHNSQSSNLCRSTIYSRVTVAATGAGCKPVAFELRRFESYLCYQ